jgi:hypothetical protein
LYLTTRSQVQPQTSPSPPALLQSNLSLALSSESKPCAPFLCAYDPSSPSHHLQVPRRRHSRSPPSFYIPPNNPRRQYISVTEPHLSTTLRAALLGPLTTAPFFAIVWNVILCDHATATETRTRTRKSRDLTCHIPCPALFEVAFCQRAADQERNAS